MTGRSHQCLVMTYIGNEYEKEYMYVCIYVYIGLVKNFIWVFMYIPLGLEHSATTEHLELMFATDVSPPEAVTHAKQ